MMNKLKFLFGLLSFTLILFLFSSLGDDKIYKQLNFNYEIGIFKNSDSRFDIEPKFLLPDSELYLGTKIEPIKSNIYKSSENYAVVSLYVNKNGEKIKIPLDKPIFSCFSGLNKDTIVITSYMLSWQLYGGFVQMGFEIKISKNGVNSTFFYYDQSEGAYAMSPKATTQNFIELVPKYQYLRLNEQPKFTINESLKGHFTFTTSDFYSFDEQTMAKLNISAEVFFKTKLLVDNFEFNRLWIKKNK